MNSKNVFFYPARSRINPNGYNSGYDFIRFFEAQIDDSPDWSNWIESLDNYIHGVEFQIRYKNLNPKRR